MGTTTLILGGGVGGLATARALRDRLAKEHRIVLVEREAQHRFAPSFLWVLTGDRTPEQIARPVARVGTRGVEHLQANVVSIDPAARSVKLDTGQELRGDHVVVALGAELDRDRPPGLSLAGHCLYDVDGASTFRDALNRLEHGRIVVLTAAPAYKCPAAPYEAAMLTEWCVRRSGHRDAVSVEIHAAEPAPMGTAGPAIGEAIRGMLSAKGIAYHPGHVVSAVEPGARTLTFQDGARVSYDLLLYVPVHRAPAPVVEAKLTNSSGWVPVDRSTLATSHPGVYAIGDVTVIPLSIGKPLPKAGVFAHAQAEVVAANIAHAVTGRGAPRSFDGHGSCFVEVGDGKAAFGTGNFFAEPAPAITLRPPARWWHFGKILFEKSWLWQHP